MRIAIVLIVLLGLSTGFAEAAGLRRIAVEGNGESATVVGAVWSPCASPAGTVNLGRLEVPGVRDCPVEGTDLPLVVISHGGRGWFGGHHDTAAALADAGYVVAAITHPDAPGSRWWSGRPAAITGLVDFMLEKWPDRERLDRERIGFFGFSRGGYTGLTLIGGKPDFGRLISHCREVPGDPLCRVPGGSRASSSAGAAALKPAVSRDPRIKAAVIAAPLGVVFSSEGLKDVSAPVQLWRPENDELATYPYNAEFIYQALPVKPDYRVVEDAGHFAILAPCTAPQALAVPRICNDAAGFDRVAFHREFNAEVLAFFQEHLKKE